MKLLSIIALAAAVTGCAANMHHPSKSFAQQKADHRDCKTDFIGSKAVQCMAAKGYVQQEIALFSLDE